MPLYVTIYTIENGKNAIAGTISLGDDGLKTDPTPGNENLLRKIIREPIQDPNTRQIVTAMSNPEEWIRALNFHFKSAYLRASQASLAKPGVQSPGSQPPIVQQQKNATQPGRSSTAPDDATAPMGVPDDEGNVP